MHNVKSEMLPLDYSPGLKVQFRSLSWEYGSYDLENVGIRVVRLTEKKTVNLW